MAYASPADFEVMDEPARSSTPPKWANPDHFDVMDEPAREPQPAVAAPVTPIIANDPFAAFNEKLSTSPLAKMPEVNLPEQPAVPDVTRTVQPVKQVTTEDVLPVAKDVPSHGVYVNETPTLVSNIREGKFGDAAALAKENVMASSPMRFLFGPTEKQQIAESVPVKKEDGSTQYEFKPASPDAVEKLGAVGAARRSISSLERGIPVTELDKAVEGEMLKDNPNDSTLQSIGKGLYNAIHRSVVAFSDPTMALIPESRIISGAFTVDMANSAKEQIQKGLEADNPREAVEGLLGGVITLGMAGMSGSHTLKKGETPTKADIIEHMDKVPDELLHEASKELKTSSPDVADAANSELIKRAADFGQELNGVLQRLPGDVQEKVNGILQKQLSGEELTANERATMLQVRSYASRLQQEQTNAEFTGSTAQPEPKPATATPASSNVGVPSGGPRIESVPPVNESQQGRSSAFAQAKAEAAAQPLREAAAAAEESSPLAAQAAKEQADLLEKRAQEQASRAKETSPPPTVEPPAQGQPEPPIAAEERPQADEPTPVTEGAAAKPALMSPEQWVASGNQKGTQSRVIGEAIKSGEPINAALWDQVRSGEPDGYTRDGDVFRKMDTQRAPSEMSLKELSAKADELNEDRQNYAILAPIRSHAGAVFDPAGRTLEEAFSDPVRAAQIKKATEAQRELLRQKYGNEVTVYRAKDKFPKMSAARTIFSWSLDKAIAEQHAKGRGRDIETQKVPVEDILWYGNPYEHEVLINNLKLRINKGLPVPKNLAEKYGYSTAKPEPGTRIVGPVLQVDGKTYAEGKIGQHHKDIVAEALNNYFKENPYAGDVPRFDHRFKDDKGNVLDREEGYQLAKKANQISPETARSVETLAESSGDKPQLHADHLITEEAAQSKPQFVLPKRAEAAGDQMVTVDIGKFDAGFAKDPQYIGEGKEDVPGRRAAFEEYEKTGKPVETPEVSVSPDGKVTFINGRHRYAVLRDRGEEAMPMAMSEESIANARKNGLLKDETPREEKQVPAESPTQASTVSGNRTLADESSAPEAPVEPKGSLLDRLESLLTEEEQPKPVEKPPQSAAAKRVADIQRDIENNANAEPAWKRRRQKDLKAAKEALAKEQTRAPAEEAAPEPAPVEKQLWQKTRDEVKAEGGILTKHRVMTRAAVERGEDVPLNVLEDYSGYHWADKARREKYGEQVSDSLLTRIIDSLKDDKGNLHFDPLFIQSVGKPALRGAVKLIREAIEAGGLAKDVLEDVVAYVKKNRPQVDEFDVRGFFEPVINEAFGKQERPAGEVDGGRESLNSPTSEPEPTPEQPTGSPRMVDEGGRELTSTKNAIVDRERQRRGEAPILSEAKKSLGTTWDEAMDEFAKNPKAGEDLVAELNKKPRAVTAKEEAVMLREKVDVMNELTKATKTALNENADPGDRVEARVRSAVLMDQLNSIDEATRKAGTEWGRTGRFRQMLAAEDYSLSRMMQKKQLALGEKWEKMSDEEKAKVNAETQKMSERIASLEKQLAEHEANQALEIERVRNEEADKAIQKMASGPETPADAYTRGVLEKIQAGLKSQADKARARIRARLGKASAGVDPTVLYDVAVIGAEKLFSTGLDFARWSSEMLSDVGDSLKHYLTEETFKQSQEINDQAIEKGAPKSVREKIKPKAPTTDAEKQQNLVNRIAEKRKNGAREAIGGSIQKLAESFVRGGITEREPLIDAVHAAVKEALPEATRKDIRDAISGYGEFKELSQDEAKVILRDLKGQMQQISKIEDMTERGKLPAKTGVQRREPSAEERQLIKEVNKIKKELGLESTDPAQLKSALDAAKTRTRNRIEDLQRAIEKKEKIPKSEKSLKEDDELRDLNAQKDALQKEYDAVFQTPKKTPEEIALAVYKARTKARIEDLNDRTKRGDFSKKERKSVALDPEGVKMRAEAERAKLEFDKGLYRDKQKNMPLPERILDYIPKIARANLLSNPITLAKLTAAALLRLGATPVEELVGGGLGKLPYVSEAASRAPREGGFNAKAEAKALTDAWMKGMKDAKDKLFKGETDLDVTGGKRNVIPHHWLDIFGSMHGALKAPVVRAEFARSFEKRTAHAAANGIDITDPAVQIRIGLEAYRDSQRAIFQQDNRVVQIWNTAMRQLEQPSKVTGRVSFGNKALQTVAKTLFPIVKIPTNIVAEAFQYATGTVTGSARLAKAFKRGIETLKPEEADLIMRELKKGVLGNAVMLLGFFASQAIGGFYQPGQRRKDGDVKPGTVRVGNIDIPQYLLHNPLVDQLQVGATIGRVANSKLRNKDRETQGLPAGVAAAALGLIEEVPFATGTEQMHKLFTPNERMAYVGELARSRVEPQFMQWMAQQGDRASYIPPSEVRQRKPESFGQEMEMGIPGLRQNVPLKRKRSWR
jgi:hypothetical protein